MVRGLTNGDAAIIVGARAEEPFVSVDDLWRRARVRTVCGAIGRGRCVSPVTGTSPPPGAVGDQSIEGRAVAFVCRRFDQRSDGA